MWRLPSQAFPWLSHPAPKPVSVADQTKLPPASTGEQWFWFSSDFSLCYYFFPRFLRRGCFGYFLASCFPAMSCAGSFPYPGTTTFIPDLPQSPFIPERFLNDILFVFSCQCYFVPFFTKHSQASIFAGHQGRAPGRMPTWLTSMSAWSSSMPTWSSSMPAWLHSSRHTIPNP